MNRGLIHRVTHLGIEILRLLLPVSQMQIGSRIFTIQVHGSPAVVRYTQTLQGCMFIIMACVETERRDLLADGLSIGEDQQSHT